MKTTTPEVLSVRAVNQYRRRDILPYVGLRYYLANKSALRDEWANKVSVHGVLSRAEPVYFHALHFKDQQANLPIEHRDIHLPGPNEAYAEAALLDECSRFPKAFESLSCVFSYRLAANNSKEGIFEGYFGGFRERLSKVKEACHQHPSGSVLYTDIKKFYPSISSALARKSWSRACDSCDISATSRQLGEKMIADHASAAQKDKTSAGLLTGPMFSHLIGNLVLRDVDVEMQRAMPGHYFRYVDDVILTGSKSDVSDGRRRLAEMLQEVDLHLHKNEKDFNVTVAEWLQEQADSDDDRKRPSWMTFVGGLKHLLLVHPEMREGLASSFRSEGMRIPLTDYAEATRESSRLVKVVALAKETWFRVKVGELTPGGLVREAIQLRELFLAKLITLLGEIGSVQGYARKQKVPLLRYYAGRLAYLASPDTLAMLGPALHKTPELRLIGDVFRCMAANDVSELLPMGINAVQAAAQSLRLMDGKVRCYPAQWDVASSQGLAILRLNGVDLDLDEKCVLPRNDLNRFATWTGDGTSLMRSSEPFVRELSCLHGSESHPRHGSILDSAFDRDEQLAFDAISQLQQSSAV